MGSINDTGRNATSLTEADVSLKLNKKGDQPVWAFEIRGRVSRRLIRPIAYRYHLCLAMLTMSQSPNGRPMTIMHDINVRVLGPRRQGELNEPLCPPPDVSEPFA